MGFRSNIHLGRRRNKMSHSRVRYKRLDPDLKDVHSLIHHPRAKRKTMPRVLAQPLRPRNSKKLLDRSRGKNNFRVPSAMWESMVRYCEIITWPNRQFNKKPLLQHNKEENSMV